MSRHNGQAVYGVWLVLGNEKGWARDPSSDRPFMGGRRRMEEVARRFRKLFPGAGVTVRVVGAKEPR